MEKALHLIVAGRVQGVGYRAWTKRLADEFGVRGAVWNRPDGGVEILVAGPAGVLAEFVKKLHVGPPSSSVSTVDILADDAEVRSETFTIVKHSFRPE